MAPGPCRQGHHSKRLCFSPFPLRGQKPFREELPLAVQQLLQLPRRRESGEATARFSFPPLTRRGPGLPQARRPGDGETPCNLNRRRAITTDSIRLEPRAAAARALRPHRHQACIFLESVAPFVRDCVSLRREARFGRDSDGTASTAGLIEIGFLLHGSRPLDFCFDNETPRHKVYLHPFQNRKPQGRLPEYLEFMSDDAYARSEVWLSEGWKLGKKRVGRHLSTGTVMPAIRPAGVSSPCGVGVDSTNYLTRRYATSVSSKPMPLRAGEVVGFQRKRNGNVSRAKHHGTGTYSTRTGCILRRRAVRASSNYSGTVGSGRQAPIPGIRDTNPFLARWANTTASS